MAGRAKAPVTEVPGSQDIRLMFQIEMRPHLRFTWNKTKSAARRSKILRSEFSTQIQ